MCTVEYLCGQVVWVLLTLVCSDDNCNLQCWIYVAEIERASVRAPRVFGASGWCDAVRKWYM